MFIIVVIGCDDHVFSATEDAEVAAKVNSQCGGAQLLPLKREVVHVRLAGCLADIEHYRVLTFTRHENERGC